MTENYTTTNGQTAYDIAIQKYGSIEYVSELIPLVDSVVEEVPALTNLSITPRDNAITRHFAGRRPIATFSTE